MHIDNKNKIILYRLISIICIIVGFEMLYNDLRQEKIDYFIVLLEISVITLTIFELIYNWDKNLFNKYNKQSKSDITSAKLINVIFKIINILCIIIFSVLIYDCLRQEVVEYSILIVELVFVVLFASSLIYYWNKDMFKK